MRRSPIKTTTVLILFGLLLLMHTGLLQAQETVLLFDDFNGTALDTSLWQFRFGGTGGNQIVQNGLLHINSGTPGGAWVTTHERFTSQVLTGEADVLILETRVRVDDTNNDHWGFVAVGNDGLIGFDLFDGNDLPSNDPRPPRAHHKAKDGLIPVTHQLPGISALEFHVYRVELESTVTRWYVDGTLVFTHPAGPLPENNMNIRLSHNGDIPNSRAGTTFVDWVRLTRVNFTPPLNVSIDIKPGSDPNCFNNDGHGVIPVAILGSATFDATQVDPSTVELEGLAIRIVGKKGNLQASFEDTNGDSFTDLIVQIEDEDGVFEPGDTTAILSGKLFDGTAIQGTDTICVVQ